MPDLSTPCLRSWLAENGAYDFSELPDAVERAEADPSVETALVALGIALDEESTRDPISFKTRLQAEPAARTFLAVLSQLGEARLIRLLEWLSEPGEPHRHVLLAALYSADAPGPARAVRAAIRLLSRKLLMRRITHRKRLETLLVCCTHYQHRLHRKEH